MFTQLRNFFLKVLTGICYERNKRSSLIQQHSTATAAKSYFLASTAKKYDRWKQWHARNTETAALTGCEDDRKITCWRIGIFRQKRILLSQKNNHFQKTWILPQLRIFSKGSAKLECGEKFLTLWVTPISLSTSKIKLQSASWTNNYS